MTFDTTTEAIEDDLKMAETAGVSRGQIALVRAQIRATLAVLTSPQIQTYTTELDGSAEPVYRDWNDRLTAAAHILGWDPIELGDLITSLDNNPDPQDDITAGQLDADAALPVLVDTDDDPDEDFFAEVRPVKKK